MKLLLDEMISGEAAARLRDRGHDVTAVVADEGLKGSTSDQFTLLVNAFDKLLNGHERQPGFTIWLKS